MVSGILGLLAIAAGLNGPTAGPDKLAQRYRLDVVIKQEVDLTAAGQGPQVSDVTGVAFVNVTMSDTTGGKIAHVVIDSMTVTATGQMGMMFSQALADSLRGQSLHAYIVDGKLSGAAKPSVEGNPVINIAMPVMQVLFPGIGSKATNAQSWSDTTRSDVTNEQGTQNSEQVVNWTVASRDGANLSLSSNGSGTVTADMNGQQVSGTVASTGTVTSPIGGPSIKAEISSTQELSVLVAALPEPIPVKITSTTTLTMMP